MQKTPYRLIMGITNLWKLLIMLVLQKQIGVGALCCLTWIMMDINIYVCNGIYHDLTNQDFVFFANEFMQKMVVTGKKEEIKIL
jgi:hypothetical protein